MKKENNTLNLILQIVLVVLSLLLAIGVKFIFHACSKPMESGMWMPCHWAEQAIFGIGIALSVISLLLLLFSNKNTKWGLALASMVIAALTVFVPNKLINLCMMDTMRCHTAMKPAVIIISIAIEIVSICLAFINLKKSAAEEN